MGNPTIDYLREFLDSPEGKESIKRFAKDLARKSEHRKRWADKFKERCESDLNKWIELLMKKYYSDAYRDREHKAGREPREPLLWVMWEYANLYCAECTDGKYFNMFTGGAYYVGSYVVQIMHGQGSVLRIDKIENP